MQQVENTRTIDGLVQHALVGAAGATAIGDARPRGRHGRPAGSYRQPNGPSEILQRLAQIIQLMRLDHTDAHLYREGCDVLAREAVEASKWRGLQPALDQVMCLVAQGDYRWALMELRAISQPEWHTC